MRIQTYMKKFIITEWRDGAVYRTEQAETDWVDLDTVDANRPADTGVIYSPAVDADGRSFRRVKN